MTNWAQKIIEEVSGGKNVEVENDLYDDGNVVTYWDEEDDDDED